MTHKILSGLMPALLLSSATVGAADQMTGEQLRELLTDATTYGKHAFKKNISAKAYRRADGTFVGTHSKKGARSGTWTIAGDQYCRHPDGEKNGCRNVFDNGDGSYHLHKKRGGSMKHVWTWVRIESGNAENL